MLIFIMHASRFSIIICFWGFVVIGARRDGGIEERIVLVSPTSKRQEMDSPHFIYPATPVCTLNKW